MRYLTLNEVLELHCRIIERYGGSAGIRGLGAGDSTLHDERMNPATKWPLKAQGPKPAYHLTATDRHVLQPYVQIDSADDGQWIAVTDLQK
ncbi:MAG: hypothetical protein ACUVXI_02605 [bacterium]